MMRHGRRFKIVQKKKLPAASFHGDVAWCYVRPYSESSHSDKPSLLGLRG